MKKYVIACLVLMLSACQSFIGATVTSTPPSAVEITTMEVPASVLDEALPLILANAEKNYSPVQTNPVLIKPVELMRLPEAVDRVDVGMRPYSQEDIRCLAINIYHESRGEPVRGQAAVAWVVMNRVQSGRYARTVCDVVYQRSSKGCQFHWVCDKKSDKPTEMKAYEQAQRIAEQVLRGEIENPIGKRLSFHAASYRGRYNAHAKNTRVVVGQHLFY